MDVTAGSFTGPLDLLLKLIEKDNSNIYDVNICSITDEYVKIINAGEATMDSMSEFIEMAARLLEIKSYMLLPPDEEEEGETANPAEELLKQLSEYKLFQVASKQFAELFDAAGDSFYRSSTIGQIINADAVTEEEIHGMLAGLTPSDLRLVFLSVLKSHKERKDAEEPRIIRLDNGGRTIGEVMSESFAFIKEVGECSFHDLPAVKKGKQEKILSFLSVLELTKSGEIEISQTEQAEIIIKRVREG